MDLTGKKIVIYCENMYQEMELWVPYYRLQEAGAQVVLAGSKANQTFTSKLGYPATTTMCYDDLEAGGFDGVIIPGGFAPDHMRRHAKANLFVKRMDEQGKLVAAICHGPWVLCSAHGMLKGRRATSFFAIKDDVVNAGAEWEDAEVVVDRNLVTSRTPADIPAFNQACLKVLASTPVAA